MSKKKTSATDRVRKVGEREEQIDVHLTEAELNESKDEVMELLDQKQLLEEKKKEVVKNYAAQQATIDLQMDGLRRLVRSGIRRDVVVVDEYLTQGNEVVRVRRDTGEQLGARTATPAELQEEMFAPGGPVERSQETDFEPEFQEEQEFADQS